jgi:hypothetical protein
MKGKKIFSFFFLNIPAFSVQGKSRSFSVLQKNLVTIIQNIELVMTVCASSLAMCAYQISEHLHLTFSDHLDLYSQQANPDRDVISIYTIVF